LSFARYRFLVLVVAAAVALFVASPAVETFVVLPQTASYTGLGMLGPQRVAADYPSDIQTNQSCAIYMDVNNQLGHAAYYQLQVKLVNESQLVNPLQVPALTSITFFVANNNSLEVPLIFSLTYTYLANQTPPQVHVTQITTNDLTASADYFAQWDPQTQQAYTYLVFELWLYNDAVGSFQYHERFVDLRLTLTP